MNRIILFIILILPFCLFSNETGWEIALPGEVLTTPLQRKDKELILICADRRIYSIDINTGRINWKKRIGGKLRDLKLSPDGSIIVRDDENLYSLYGSGDIRWIYRLEDGFKSDLSLNERGDIFFVSGTSIIGIDRFGIKYTAIPGVQSNTVINNQNSLISYIDGKSINAVSYGGKPAWTISLKEFPLDIHAVDRGLAVIYKSGIVELYSNKGEFIDSINTNNKNPSAFYINYRGDYLLKGDLGVSLITLRGVTLYNNENNYGLYYSNGFLITSYSDWTLKSEATERDSLFFPSGKKQKLERTISLSNKVVWGDEKNREFYKESMLGGNRDLQIPLLMDIETNLGNSSYLDKQPNFYNLLLWGSSTVNPNSDIRQEAYRLMGVSRDISFLPYLLSDLESEDSYQILPYIYYALGQIGVDRNGEVVSLINSRVDDYHDEKVVINALYALYNINEYSNGEFLDSVYTGIEKILQGGYSRNIETRCYDIIKKIKQEH